MDGPTFMSFAWRISAYDGVIARRVEAQSENSDRAPAAPPSSSSAQTSTGRSELPGLAAMQLENPGLIERVTVQAHPPIQPD